MQGTRVLMTFHTAGALAANHSYVFKLPFPVTLIGVSVAASNASNAIIDIGKTAALEAYVKDMDAGDSAVAATLTAPSSFVGSSFPHIDANTNIIVTVDYDGAGGTAAQDLTTVLTFTEG